jgi:hypothetical protein
MPHDSTSGEGGCAACSRPARTFRSCSAFGVGVQGRGDTGQGLGAEGEGKGEGVGGLGLGFRVSGLGFRVQGFMLG